MIGKQQLSTEYKMWLSGFATRNWVVYMCVFCLFGVGNNNEDCIIMNHLILQSGKVFYL